MGGGADSALTTQRWARCPRASEENAERRRDAGAEGLLLSPTCSSSGMVLLSSISLLRLLQALRVIIGFVSRGAGDDGSLKPSDPSFGACAITVLAPVGSDPPGPDKISGVFGTHVMREAVEQHARPCIP